MNRDDALLQGLRHKLQTWLAFVQKSSLATDVQIIPTTNQEFLVRVSWEKPVPGSHEKIFDRPAVFGRSMQLSPGAWSVQKCVADFARDIVREVLAARGI